MSLNGKVAVVLGASAEAGTGWKIAEVLAEAGAKVVVAARRLKPLEVLAKRIGGKAFVCDAARPDQIAALAAAAVEAYGKIDIAVNSAGEPVMGAIADIDPAEAEKAFAINFFGNFYFVRHMTAAMNDGGSVILISTSASVQPVYPLFAYGCAKAATDSLVRYAALEFGPRGIRVNSILPGPIKTEMTAAFYKVPGAERVFEREIPLGRVGMPKDFANVTAWLAGDHYITGVNLPVSGGIHLTRAPRADELPGGGGYDVAG